MFFMSYLFLFLSVVGLAGVSSNPSPNYAALSLVLMAGSGCGLLVCMGSSFLSLILFLIYLGGMLVVFAYSIAFTTNLDLNDQENYSSLSLFIMFMVGVLICCLMYGKGSEKELWIMVDNYSSYSTIQESAVGVSFLYSWGGGFLVIGSLALLVALLVVLMVVRGPMQGSLRAV